MVKMLLIELLHTRTWRSRYLDVSTIKETAKSVLLAAESYSPVGFAMIKLAITQWIGKLLLGARCFWLN